MAGFFGPGGLSNYQPTPLGGLDPQLLQGLMAAFPGLAQLQSQPGQQGAQSLASLGYQGQGPTLFQGQGVSPFTLSPFEGVSGVSPESITSGLAAGTFGKSASQSPLSNTGQQAGGLLSLPSLQLPMAQVAATQGGYGGGEEFTPTGGGETGQGGFTVTAGDVLGAGKQALNLFPGTSDLGNQTTTPGYAEQRAGERDLTTLGGSFLPSNLPQSTPGDLLTSQFTQGQGPTTLPNLQNLIAPFPSSTPGDVLTNQWMQGQGSTELPNLQQLIEGGGPTMFAPGGANAQQILGGQAPSGDVLGGGLSTLQGLYNLYGGTQSGNIGQILGGLSGTIGGAGQMAPETVAALSQYLGLGQGGLGLAAGGLGGLAGGYGLYQGVQQGDPMQALTGAAGLYSGLAPIANYALGTSLPTLSSLAGSAASSLGLGAGAGAGAAGAGAAGAGAAGAGAAGGTAAGGVAAGTVGLALAPVVAGYLGASIDAMLSKQEAMDRAAQQMRRLTAGINPTISDWSQAPGLLGQLTPQTTPEEARALYDQLSAIQNRYQQSGMEQFLMQGGTASMYGPGGSIGFDQGPALAQNLRPFTSAYDVGLLRAIDAMARGGMDVSGLAYGTPEAAARAFGGNASYIDPESGSKARGAQYNPYLQANYAPAYTQTNQADLLARGIDPNAYGMGLQGPVYGTQEPFRSSETPWFLGGEGGLTRWSPQAQADFAKIQPGHFEERLAQLFGGQFTNPMFQAYGFGTGQVPIPEGFDQVTPQLQQFTQQLGGLTQQAPQLLQAAQTSLQGAPVSSLGIPTSGAGSNITSGGIDLEALLRQLGYLR